MLYLADQPPDQPYSNHRYIITLEQGQIHSPEAAVQASLAAQQAAFEPLSLSTGWHVQHFVLVKCIGNSRPEIAGRTELVR